MKVPEIGAIRRFVGPADGRSDGFLEVGVTVGVNGNGCDDGFDVFLEGAEVYLIEGLIVGARKSRAVVSNVGQSDVLADGIRVGFTVVSRVGFRAGFADRIDVRVTVGTEVDFLDGNTLLISEEVGG